MNRLAVVAALSIAAAICPSLIVATPQKAVQNKEDSFLSVAPLQVQGLACGSGRDLRGAAQGSHWSAGDRVLPDACRTRSTQESRRVRGTAATDQQQGTGSAETCHAAPSGDRNAGASVRAGRMRHLAERSGKRRDANGVLEIKHAPGQIVVDFAKSGYEGQQIVIPLRAGARAVSSVTLTPGNAMQQQIGNEVFAKMLDRFGGKAGVSDALYAGGHRKRTIMADGRPKNRMGSACTFEDVCEHGIHRIERRRTPLVDFAPG